MADIYHGADGVDHFQGNGGDDVFYGNDGSDVAYYSGDYADYLIIEVGFGRYSIEDLRAGSPDGVDQLIDVNRLSFADREVPLIIKGLTLVGTDDDETLAGGDDSDEIDGGDGSDQLIGCKGQDQLRGGSGDDALLGGEGADRLVGGDCNDRFTGGPGNGIIVGGEGRDEYIDDQGSYTMSDAIRSGIVVNLTAGFARSADVGEDALDVIEDVKSGSGDDHLIGDGKANYLFAWEEMTSSRGCQEMTR